LEHDYQLCVHAIGDRANRETLNVFEEAFRERPEKTDLRWRVEHAQHLHPADIPRFRQLGVIASMQAVHCTSDAPFVVRRLGRRRAEQGAYAWRSLLDAGAVVINGTDTPVEPVDPIACFYSSVTRKWKGGEALFPGQRMTRHEALRSYTRSAAYAAFEEDLKGSLSPGKLADIAVLSRDILSVPEEQIREAEVLYTIVGGRVVYQRRAAKGSQTRGRQGREKERQRNVRQGNEGHLPIPLPPFPCPHSPAPIPLSHQEGLGQRRLSCLCVSAVAGVCNNGGQFGGAATCQRRPTCLQRTGRTHIKLLICNPSLSRVGQDLILRPSRVSAYTWKALG
jgi:hypothetical protein